MCVWAGALPQRRCRACCRPCWAAFSACSSLTAFSLTALPCAACLPACSACADAEYDHDAGLEMLDSRKVGKAREGQQQREKQRQVREYNKLNSALVSEWLSEWLTDLLSAGVCGGSVLGCLGMQGGRARVARSEGEGGSPHLPVCPLCPPPLPLLQEQCRLCFSSSNRPRHLTLSIGQSSYLALPPRGRLVPGHCQIIPAEHVASTRQTDEQVGRAGLCGAVHGWGGRGQRLADPP
jgi:hypothetical protein